MSKQLPKRSPYWWVYLLEGIIQLILGFLLLVSPDVTTIVLVQFLGIYWLIRGLIMVIRVFATKEKNKGWMLLGALLGIVAGILVLRYPLFSAFILLDILLVLIALVGMVQGTISIVQGFMYKMTGEVILGFVLWLICLFLFVNPLSSVLALPFVIGILWIIGGTALTVMSLSSK